MVTWGSDGVEVINSEVDHVGRSGLGHCIYGAGHSLLVDNANIHHCARYGISNLNGYTNQNVNNHIIRNSRVHDNGQAARNAGDGGGINLGEGSGHLIYNNVVYNNAGRGIEIAWEYCENCIAVYNNTVYKNGSSGIWIQGGYRGIVVRNNIAYLNLGDFQNDGTGTVISNNVFGTNPLFVNADAGDFKLQTASPAREAGISLSQVQTDRDGVPRPQGSAYDAGAFELRAQGTSPAPPANVHIVSSQ
jgi:parallel beta-helix repeat protein